MGIRRTSILTILWLIAAGAAVSRADPTPEQLKAMYEDSQRQLQQSQDRKNQLANENEQLKTRVAELETQLRTITFQARQVQFLRNQFTVWASFMRQYPALLKRFETYVNGDSGFSTSSSTSVSPETFYDPQWPFSAASAILSDEVQ